MRIRYVSVFSKVGCEDPVHRSTQKTGVRVKRDTLSSNEILMLDTSFTAFLSPSQRIAYRIQDHISVKTILFFYKMTCFQSRFSFAK